MHLPLSLLLLIAPLLSASPLSSSNAPKRLTGRFLHLTDMHPDTFYSYNSSVSAACHWDKPTSKGVDRAGWWGTPVSECDTPSTLLTSLFDFLKPLKGEIDFVVWTGDNARHDIDSKVPRSLPEIMKLNKVLASKVREVLGKDVKVVASVGNNDVFPHNIMWPGPSSITTELLDTWKHFIPESNKHTFARGGYYSVEAIPDTLLLVSLNTLYFFENNKIVDGCPDIDDDSASSDPGTEHLQWLEQQLILARAKGMQVWLSGHVPPTAASYYSNCFAKYSDLVLRFHDTIVGQLFGHMNVDHFAFLIPSASLIARDPPIKTKVATSAILSNLLSSFNAIPPKVKPRLYSPIHVSPSVIPTYWPSVRIWNYNTTKSSAWTQPIGTMAEEEVEEEEEGVIGWLKSQQVRFFDLGSEEEPSQEDDDLPPINSEKKKKKKKEKTPKKPKKPVPHQHYSSQSPSNTNRFLTPLGYTQFHLNLDSANENSGYGPGLEGETLFEERGEEGERPYPKWTIEYTTYPADVWVESVLGPAPVEESPLLEGVEEAQPSFVPVEILLEGMERKFRTLVEAEDRDGVIKWLSRAGRSPYKMKSGTVKDWLHAARKLVKEGEKGKKWKRFVKRFFVGSGVKE